MSGYSGLSGQYGDMPYDALLRKSERTCLFESPNKMDNYMRNVLRDEGPDDPFLEAHEPRRNNHSMARINTRTYASRVETDPWLPDGTFTDWQFTQPDPRGTAVGPNMQQYTAQRMARGRYIKFYDDQDNSIPEERLFDGDVYRNIAQSLRLVSDRLRIFDTSKDSRHNGGTMNVKLTKTGAALQTADGTILDINEASAGNRSNLTDELSNKYKIGWRRTTDHKFKVSTYGKQRFNLGDSAKNTWKNRKDGSHMTQDVMMDWEGLKVPTSLVLLMSNLVSQKNIKYNTFDTFKGKESSDGKNRSKKLQAKDIAKILWESQQAQTLKNSVKMTNRSMAEQKLDPRFGKSIVDPKIVSFMAQSNRKMKERDRDDLRNQIEQTAKSMSLIVSDQSNRLMADRENIRDNMNLAQIDHKGKDRTSYNTIKYKTAALPSGESHLDYFNGEEYTGESADAKYRKRQKNKKMVAASDYDADMIYADSGVFSKHIGGVSSRDHGMAKMDRERNPDDTLNDNEGFSNRSRR